MKTKDVIKHFGGVQKTAEAIGYTRQGVYKWRKMKFVPESAQPRVELASQGKFRASVSLERRRLTA